MADYFSHDSLLETEDSGGIDVASGDDPNNHVFARPSSGTFVNLDDNTPENGDPMENEDIV